MTTTTANGSLELLVDRLIDAGCRPRNGSARCPAHEDRNPSLGYGLHGDGWAFVKCHAQACPRGAILEALGLDWRALAPAPSATPVTHGPPPVTTLEPPHDPDVLADWSEQAHHRLIGADQAGPARAYLRSRGVTGEDVRTYRLGYAVDHLDRKLHRLRGRIVYTEWPWRAEGRVVPGLEGAAYKPERKYQTEGPKRAWGLSEVEADWPVVLVEGPLDRIAVGRIADPSQTVALCGSSGVRTDDVAALRARGVAEVLVLLDADVTTDKLGRVMADLAAGGIRPLAVSGLTDGDPGGLLPGLTSNDRDAWAALSHALTTPEGGHA